MWSDVIDLRDFYETSLGQMVRRLLRRRLREMWPDVAGERLLGLGFAAPLLWSFRDEAERVLCIMPSAQGVLAWPPGEPSLTALADETDLPLPDRSVDRLVVIHALESTEHVRGMMREIWRVLADSGRVILIVPNRRGIWARLERTPFGYGRPYSPKQLSRLLRDNMFTPLQSSEALYIPPLHSRMMLRSAPVWEQIGHRWFQSFAGVLLVEAAKQFYAGTAIRAEDARESKRKRAYIPMPQGFRRESCPLPPSMLTSSSAAPGCEPPGFRPGGGAGCGWEPP